MTETTAETTTTAQPVKKKRTWLRLNLLAVIILILATANWIILGITTANDTTDALYQISQYLLLAAVLYLVLTLGATTYVKTRNRVRR